MSDIERPTVTDAERAALDNIQGRLDAVNADGYTGTAALLGLIVTDVPWLLALARRAGAHCCPVSQEGYTAGVVAERLDAWLGMPMGYPPIDRALADWREARDAAVETLTGDVAAFARQADLAERRAALLEGLLRETLPYVEESLCVLADPDTARLLDRVQAATADGGEG